MPDPARSHPPGVPTTEPLGRALAAEVAARIAERAGAPTLPPDLRRLLVDHAAAESIGDPRIREQATRRTGTALARWTRTHLTTETP
jgi:hypothetical protein